MDKQLPVCRRDVPEDITEDEKKIKSCLFKASVVKGWCFLYGGGVFHVPGERGVPAGGAGKYTELLLDGADHDKGRRCIPVCL